MRYELSSFLLLCHGLPPCLSAKMDSYTSGRASQSKLSLSHRLFLVMVFYHSDRKVTGTLTQDMIFLLCHSRRSCFGEGPLCFFPEGSPLPLSFPAIDFISCGFLISSASSLRYDLITSTPLLHSFRDLETLHLLVFCHSTMHLHIGFPQSKSHDPSLLYIGLLQSKSHDRSPLCNLYSELCQ